MGEQLWTSRPPPPHPPWSWTGVDGMLPRGGARGLLLAARVALGSQEGLCRRRRLAGLLLAETKKQTFSRGGTPGCTSGHVHQCFVEAGGGCGGEGRARAAIDGGAGAIAKPSGEKLPFHLDLDEKRWI